jgi:hypothetical protein
LAKLIRPRRLWYESKGEITHLDEAALLGCSEPIVILGEAGMGKTEIASHLSMQAGYAGCTARQLLRRGARSLLGDARTLVIDALDEVGTRDEGDAVDSVLEKLAEADFPHFVLTCRVADWRNATSLSALREDYPDREPLVLHLEPFREADIINVLADRLPEEGDAARSRAVEIVEHFEARNLGGLLGNPQTLELVARAVDDSSLPDNKAALFAKAVAVLRREHRDEKIALQPDEATSLDAAGAAFASLILTGAEAVVRDIANPEEGELPWSEVVSLPGAAALEDVLGSRLFGGKSAERFTYWHRSIGEYLGARWLVSRIKTALDRQRMLQLFHADALVPASLRGLHAWLAHQGDREIALAVIARDPMGVIEYGDGDVLGLEEARALLLALLELATRDPHFRDWKAYSVRSLMQEPLLPEVRAIIVDAEVEFGLRSLLLEGVSGSALAGALRDDLRRILLDPSEVYSHRYRSASALAELGDEDWQSLLQHLRDEDTHDSVRLALEVAINLDRIPISDELLVALLIRRAEYPTRSVMLFGGLDKALPDDRLDNFLDGFVSALPKLGNRHERPNNDELTDLGYDLIARRLELGKVEPLRLWRWLRPFDENVGFSRDVRKTVHDHICADDGLRRAIQKHVLFDEPGDKTLWQRAWRLTSRSPGFAPTEDDVLLLFDQLDPDEREGDRWRDLVQLVRHSETEGERVRARAKEFVANRADMLAWIDKLANPDRPEREVRQDKERRRREAKRAMAWQEHRKDFGEHIEEMRRGDFQWIANPAQAYLKLFHDLGDDLPAHQRVAQWLGEDIAQAAHEGFEAFLLSDAPPTAQEIAESHAKSKRWNAVHVIVAGVAERVRRLGAIALADVSDDRLLTAFHELRWANTAQHAGLEELVPVVSAEIERRGLFETATRQWIEPQLAAACSHVDQLYASMRDENRRDLATALAEEWLRRFPEMPAEVEGELLDRLLIDGRFDVLRELEAERRASEISTDRRANWDAVAFAVDFEAQRDRLTTVAEADPNWLWTLRNRLSSDRGRYVKVRLSIAQLAWIVATFRGLFPRVAHPTGAYSGDANPWDATDFLFATANRIANDTSDEAIRHLTALQQAPADGYTDGLRALVAEQVRKAVQERYRPASLAELRAIVEGKPPANVADLQAAVVALLQMAQARIRSSPDDAWRGFYNDTGQPRDEERCRDHLLTILGLHPEGIDLLPEGHLADDKRADIIALRPGMRLPVEVKGQWHPELWRAAGDQLEQLYTVDYAAERRGIYLVLWFGLDVTDSKKPRALKGQRRRRSADELRAGLIQQCPSSHDGSIEVVVLDVSRAPGR